MKKIILLFSLSCLNFGFSQTPTTAAPTPPARSAANVVSIYGSAYTNVSGVNTNPNWGQNTVTTEVAIAGNNTLQYANFNYQGTDWASTPQNISTMEYLHVDIWTNSEAPRVFVISTGPEVPHAISSVPGSWQSLDIPVTGITGSLSNTIQFKFDNGTGGTIFLDNLYFWKTATVAGADAFLSDLQVNGTTVNGFSATTYAYTVGIPAGFTGVPQLSAVTNDSNATKVITQATGVPGTATVVVTSQNSSVTKTYTVNYVVMGPTFAAPTPPSRNASDVISLFSNAYTNIPIDSWSATWDDSSYTDMQVFGNDTKKIDFGNFLGVEFITNRFDASSFTNFHMDFWTDNTDLIGKVFNSKFSQWGGGTSEVSALELNINTGTTPAIVPGTWVSIDVPFSSWTNNTTRTDLTQFIITSNLGTVYVDNIYLYKGTVGTSQFDIAKFVVYPNPAHNDWKIDGNQNIITSVVLTDILGQQVQVLNPNSTNVTINGSELANGVYYATVTSDNGSKVLKLVKN